MNGIEIFTMMFLVFALNLYMIKYENMVISTTFLIFHTILIFSNDFGLIEPILSIPILMFGFLEIYMNLTSIFHVRMNGGKK